MTLYLGGGAYEVRDAAGDAETLKYYGIAGQRVAMQDDGGVKYLLTDHLGSVSAVLDAVGNLLAEQRYTPFGEARFDIALGTTDFGYTGQRLLAGTGLVDAYNVWLIGGRGGIGVLRISLRNAGEREAYLQDREVVITSALNTQELGLWVFGYELRPPQQLFGAMYDANLDRFIEIQMPEVFAGDGIHEISNAVQSNSRIFVVINGYLYSINPSNGVVQLELKADEHSAFGAEQATSFGQSIASNNEESLWLIIKTQEMKGASFFLASYSVATGRLETVELMPLLRGQEVKNLKLTLLIDSTERVWVSDFGWFDSRVGAEYPWMYLVRPSIFFASLTYTPGGVFYLSGRPEFETDERYIWFTSEAGLALLNTEEKEWCLVSTSDVLLVSLDANGRVWLASGGKLHSFEN